MRHPFVGYFWTGATPGAEDALVRDGDEGLHPPCSQAGVLCLQARLRTGQHLCTSTDKQHYYGARGAGLFPSCAIQELQIGYLCSRAAPENTFGMCVNSSTKVSFSWGGSPVPPAASWWLRELTATTAPSSRHDSTQMSQPKKSCHHYDTVE